MRSISPLVAFRDKRAGFLYPPCVWSICKQGCLFRDTYADVADSHPYSPVDVAIEVHYPPASTAGGDVGDATDGAARFYENLTRCQFDGRRIFILRVNDSDSPLAT